MVLFNQIIYYISLLGITFLLISYICSWICNKLLKYFINIRELFCCMIFEVVKFLRIDGQFYENQTVSTLSQSKSTTCKSPECVRCQRYALLKQEASTYIKDFTNLTNSACELEQISRAVIECEAQSENSLNVTKRQQPNVLFIGLLVSCPWWEVSYSSVLYNINEVMRSNYNDIFKEFHDIYTNLESHHWKLNTSENGQWNVFHLYNQGRKIIENCSACPITATLVESLETFMKSCVFGNACFSVLYPGTKITSHCGPANIRLRCHLG